MHAPVEVLFHSDGGGYQVQDLASANAPGEDAVRRYNVRLNPLYDPDFPLLSVQSQQGSNVPVVVVSLAGGNGAPAVRDVS